MIIVSLPMARQFLIVGSAALLCLAAASSATAAAPNEPAKEPNHPPSIALWPNGAPGSDAHKDEAEKVDWRVEPDITFPIIFNIHNPSITPFIPDKSTATGAAVIIAPGGGHMFLTIDREGYDLGKWLADHGIAAFVLKYRLAKDKAGNSPYKVEVDALADAKRSMRLVRSRAAEWGVDPNRVGFLGFSAGGQLAGLLGTQFDSGDPSGGDPSVVDRSGADPIDKLSCRPDFQGLIYGGPYTVETFSDQTPPSFLACAYNDNGNVVKQANLFLKLQAAKIPAELHIYSTGGHGFGVRTDRAIAVQTWPQRFVDWMGDIGMLGKKR